MEGRQPQAFDRHTAAMTFRRNMPHWRQDHAVYFVTFRLADSLPAERLAELRQIRSTGFQPVTDNAKELLRRMDRWLRAGHGSCCLGRPEVADIVEGAMRFFDGRRYHLGPYVIMPNHVHTLVMPLAGHELSRILHSWKSFTANAINQRLGREGALWQDESFDHIVRDDESMRFFTQYIEENAAAVPAGRARLGRGGLEV
jgi:REP element-mobilizing transposase RayT